LYSQVDLCNSQSIDATSSLIFAFAGGSAQVAYVRSLIVRNRRSKGDALVTAFILMPFSLLQLVLFLI